MSKSIVLIRFSFRDFGNCASVSREVTRHYSTAAVNSYMVDSKLIQPCNNCDYECLNPQKACPHANDAQKEVMDAICNADMAYFIVPNYCGYPCANYFAFNERTVGYFNLKRELMQKYMNVPKRFIMISNTEGSNFANAMKQQVNGEPDILYLKSGKYGKKSTAGDIMESDEARADLEAFLKQHSI